MARSLDAAGLHALRQHLLWAREGARQLGSTEEVADITKELKVLTAEAQRRKKR